MRPGLLLCTLAFAVCFAALGENPADKSCARCHQQIYTSYEQTPMAHASGPAMDGLIPGDFTHAASGIHYRIFEKDGKAWLSYDRPTVAPDQSLHGQQELLYYLGSGRRGRTYLFDQQGYWFESPINWYAKKQIWDMAPNYLSAKQMPFTLPVDEGCLHCHASGVQQALPGSRNHFSGAPFAHGGIGCSSCHGNAAAHLSSGGKMPVLNPDKLPTARRDSICLECHLEGETSVARQGHRIGEFHPGDNIFDQVVYFVHQSSPTERATSQWEALLRSACKRKSGERMTCTTCHDPHSTPAPQDRVAFYRSKCLACHGEAAFVAKHHPDQPDCTACHMARRRTEDIAHEQVTDHDIQSVAGVRLQDSAPRTSNELVTVGGEAASDRDFGLAYAQVATGGNRAAGERALSLLEKAEQSDPDQATDTELHTRLGFLLEMNRQPTEAAVEYQTALKADPLDSIAAGDLAVLLAESGDFQSAQRLWSKVFADDPTQTAAGVDLAVADCRLHRPQDALATLDRVMAFSPDDLAARQLRLAISSGRRPCTR